MKTLMLNHDNIEMLIQLEQDARVSEPDIFVEDFDVHRFREETNMALTNPTFSSARCMMCVNDEGLAVGRIDFAIVPSFSFGGNVQVYVDWVYVLKEHRHRGVAQFLFAQMEEYIKAMGIDEYFLLMAENSEAQSFYRSIERAKIAHYDVLKKHIV